MRVALLALLSVAVFAAPAAAAPPGQGLESFPLTCDGTTVSSGASFWMGDQHYVLTSFTGTFTPEGGRPETSTRTFGQKTGLAGSEITSSATFVEPGVGTLRSWPRELPYHRADRGDSGEEQTEAASGHYITICDADL